MDWLYLLQSVVTITLLSGCGGEVDINHLLVEDPYNFNLLTNPQIPVEIPAASQPNEGDYDFIIIGSGSAGSVIASRLSEIASWKVLLLEAGLPGNALTEFPSLAGILQFTDYNWGYATEPQTHSCLAMVERRCNWLKGRALGGTSTTHSMVYSRGHPEDYNRWAVLGNPGWSYAGVLPYFLKSEKAELKLSNPSYHNKAGVLEVTDPYISELGNTFLSAGQELGYPIVDYNSPLQIGFSSLQANIKRGRRHSNVDAFLTPVMHRDNLKILTRAFVTKILIDPYTKTACGVEYHWNNKNITVKATKEVILSAGVVNSAQLLMVSGVGPKLHLEELGIPVINDLPVGQTVYDHLIFSGLVINIDLTEPPPTFDSLQILQWYITGQGPLSRIEGSEALAFLRLNSSIDDLYPDMELLLRAGSVISDNGTIGRRVLGVSDEYYNSMFMPLQGPPSFTILPILQHPKSKGFIKLKSSNPFEHPAFYPNYLTDPEGQDIATMLAAIRFIERLCETASFKRYNARMSRKPFVGCEHLPFDSDEHWKCALHTIASPADHQTSTCKMGPADDPTAVVNNELKVYGIENLRVADASIIPIPLSGHTHAPVVMIGEVAADLIKKDWGVLVDSPNK